MKVEEKYKSSTHYVLSALMPYTEANLKLSFVPKRFFADLARLERIEENTLRNAYHRAIKKGLIIIDPSGTPRLSDKGHRKLAPYQSKELKGAELMVIFDIPERFRFKRDRLRLTLREFGFTQIQKSVWTSTSDSREYLHSELDELKLRPHVQVYECRKL